MPGKPRLVYWDACIFIAWLKNEQRPDPADLDGITYLVEEWQAGQLVIATSTITRIEVLDSTLTEQQQTLFRRVLRQSKVRVFGVTGPIADTAHALRDFYPTPRLSTPDAIHLATAIAWECAAFFTFDGARDEKKKRKLLPLGPTIAGQHTLPTEMPRRPTKSQAAFVFKPKKP